MSLTGAPPWVWAHRAAQSVSLPTLSSTSWSASSNERPVWVLMDVASSFLFASSPLARELNFAGSLDSVAHVLPASVRAVGEHTGAIWCPHRNTAARLRLAGLAADKLLVMRGSKGPGGGLATQGEAGATPHSTVGGDRSASLGRATHGRLATRSLRRASTPSSTLSCTYSIHWTWERGTDKLG
ncbi:hypothetical protein CRUP_008354 [Coryphaenoides rupestris]|nr:hypothetical protein CRUP_008354 [Coryphaenoides rupestris]